MVRCTLTRDRQQCQTSTHCSRRDALVDSSRRCRQRRCRRARWPRSRPPHVPWREGTRPDGTCHAQEEGQPPPRTAICGGWPMGPAAAEVVELKPPEPAETSMKRSAGGTSRLLPLAGDNLRSARRAGQGEYGTRVRGAPPASGRVLLQSMSFCCIQSVPTRAEPSTPERFGRAGLRQGARRTSKKYRRIGGDRGQRRRGLRARSEAAGAAQADAKAPKTTRHSAALTQIAKERGTAFFGASRSQNFFVTF